MNASSIYLIDDDGDLVRLLSDAVESIGQHTKGFTQARVFFEQVTSFPKGSILVLDLNMPEMDGIEVMRRLTGMNSPPSLILISGTDSGVLHAAEKLGQAHKLKILASLEKPISIPYFRTLLQQSIMENTEHQNSIKTSIKYQPGAEELHEAIHNQQLVLHYQPQIRLENNTLTGVEALIRWQHPEYGLLYPDRFISLAEQHGLMADLTNWVIDSAMLQVHEWQKENFSLPVSVNISASDITSLTLPEHIAELLSNNKLEPTKLALEVTESALMGELITSLDILTRLRLKGIGLSIDDFGTGYSSLSQLHKVPFSDLKIDRSFVSSITKDSEAKAIVKTCIILGHELNMRVIAEGVETSEQLLELKLMNCDIAQGFLFSHV